MIIKVIDYDGKEHIVVGVKDLQKKLNNLLKDLETKYTNENNYYKLMFDKHFQEVLNWTPQK